MSELNQRTRVHACRICRNVIISDEISFDNKSDCWLQMYQFCFQISITCDETPRNLCSECGRKLKDFTDFKNQALISENIWKSNNLNSMSSDYVKYESIIYEDKNFDHIPFHKNDECLIESKHDENINEDQQSFDYDESDDVNFKDETVDYLKDQSKLKVKAIKLDVKGNLGRKRKSTLRTVQSTKRNKIISKPLPDAPLLTCGLCEVKLLDKTEMKGHLTDHSNNDSNSCSLCNFVGRDFADIVIHRYDHFPKEYRIQLNCYICNKKYLAKLALQFHYRSVHLKKKGGLCTQCGKQFSTYTMWRNHEKLHTSENFKCDLCGRKFLFRHALKTHMINHSEVKGYVCDVCGKGFKRNSNLKLHLQTAHDSNKVKCDHCNGTFKNQNSLKAHLQRVTKEKTFQCAVCSKYFDTANILKRHMVWHRDERPYICSVCGLSYKSTSQLNTHMRKHTGVMPFKCDQCTKSYPTSNQLREHMSNHSGERRYKCAQCPKSFHHKKLMVKHCSKRHSESTEEQK